MLNLSATVLFMQQYLLERWPLEKADDNCFTVSFIVSCYYWWSFFMLLWWSAPLVKFQAMSNRVIIKICTDKLPRTFVLQRMKKKCGKISIWINVWMREKLKEIPYCSLMPVALRGSYSFLKCSCEIQTPSAFPGLAYFLRTGFSLWQSRLEQGEWYYPVLEEVQQCTCKRSWGSLTYSLGRSACCLYIRCIRRANVQSRSMGWGKSAVNVSKLRRSLLQFSRLHFQMIQMLLCVPYRTVVVLLSQQHYSIIAFLQ